MLRQSSGRHLLVAGDSGEQQCSSGSAAAQCDGRMTAGVLGGQRRLTSTSVVRALGQPASSSSSSLARAGGNSSMVLLSADDAVLMAAVTRHPAPYSLHQLHMSILTLSVVMAVATLVQLLVLALWRFLRLSLDDMPM